MPLSKKLVGLERFFQNSQDLIEEGYYSSRILANVPNLYEAIRSKPFSIIAELKVKAPNAQFPFFHPEDAEKRLKLMASEADALSILVEPNFFGGSINYLSYASNLGIPLLMKDFIVDPVQLSVAPKGCGILLIKNFLRDNVLDDLIKECHRKGLVPVVEVHTIQELREAIELDAEIIGINNRNLTTFELKVNHAERLANKIETEKILLGFSGYSERKGVINAYKSNLSGILVGTSISQTKEPDKFIRNLNPIQNQ